MVTMTRVLAIGICLLLIGFGIATLHYCFGPSYEHHLQWAQQNGMPAPGMPLFILGCTVMVCASGFAGFYLGSVSRGRRIE